MTKKLIDLTQTYGLKDKKFIANQFSNLTYDQVTGKIRRLIEKGVIIVPEETIAKAFSIQDLDDSIELLKDIIDPLEYLYGKSIMSPIETEDINITIPLKKDFQVKEDITLTLVMSDLHLGDADHLHETYWSAIGNLKAHLATIKQYYDVKEFKVIGNGDLVAGTGVYRGQEFRNVVQRAHWQVALAHAVLDKTFSDLSTIVPISRMYLIRGTHETNENNYIMYLKKYLPNTYYLGHSKVINIAHPVSDYNVMFTHGTGSNTYFALSLSTLRDVASAVGKYALRGVEVKRACCGHTHQLQPGIVGSGITFDITGGFQRWEKTISQRDCGMLLYMCTKDSFNVIPIRPSSDIEFKEKGYGDLEFKNMQYYATMLMDALLKEKEFDGLPDVRI